MEIDFNKIVTELLEENKVNDRSAEYKGAYVDGVLDFINKIKKEKE